MAEVLGCAFNERRFGDIWNAIMRHSPDYVNEKFAQEDKDVAYWGVEFIGNPKHPNETYLHNLYLKNGGIVLGSTLGHWHIQKDGKDLEDKRTYQELYEFFGYGAMLLRNERQGTRLHLLKPGEKVLIRTDENMMFMNLDNPPLFTYDYADPDNNGSNKDQEKKDGPFLMATYKGATARFYVNPKYNPNAKSPLELKMVGLGKDLYNRIKKEERAFLSDLGIIVKTGGNLPTSHDNLKKKLASPLIELAMSSNTDLSGVLKAESNL